MEISCYNFFFHPFHQGHTQEVTALSLITNLALTILTLGLYLAAFLCVHLLEGDTAQKSPLPGREIALESPVNNPIPPAVFIPGLPRRGGFVGIQALKEKQRAHLAKLQLLANQGQWQHLQTHTIHPDSGFDWWMFPIDKSSLGQGDLYKVSPNDIALLKLDPEFLQNYREGVCLVARSWGWDLKNRVDLTNHLQRWTGYGVRLYKMMASLRLLGQNDLLDSLQYFMDMKRIRI